MFSISDSEAAISDDDLGLPSSTTDKSVINDRAGSSTKRRKISTIFSHSSSQELQSQAYQVDMGLTDNKDENQEEFPSYVTRTKAKTMSSAPETISNKICKTEIEEDEPAKDKHEFGFAINDKAESISQVNVEPELMEEDCELEIIFVGEKPVAKAPLIPKSIELEKPDIEFIPPEFMEIAPDDIERFDIEIHANQKEYPLFPEMEECDSDIEILCEKPPPVKLSSDQREETSDSLSQFTDSDQSFDSGMGSHEGLAEAGLFINPVQATRKFNISIVKAPSRWKATPPDTSDSTDDTPMSQVYASLLTPKK